MSLRRRHSLDLVVLLLPCAAAVYSDSSVQPHHLGATVDRDPGDAGVGPAQGLLIQGQLAPVSKVQAVVQASGNATGGNGTARGAGNEAEDLEEQIHSLRRELDELREEKRHSRPVKPWIWNPLIRIQEFFFNPVKRAMQAVTTKYRGKDPHLSQHDQAQDQDPLSGYNDYDGNDGDDYPTGTYAGPPSWDVYTSSPMVFVIPTVFLLLLVYAWKVMSATSEAPVNPPTRAGMPAWNTKTDAIFSASDQDRDGFLSYSDMRWMARVTNPDSAGHFTFEWYKDLCRPLGVDPHRGFDREEFRQSLMLLGNDVDRDYEVVTRSGAPPQQAQSSGCA